MDLTPAGGYDLGLVRLRARGLSRSNVVGRRVLAWGGLREVQVLPPGAACCRGGYHRYAIPPGVWSRCPGFGGYVLLPVAWRGRRFMASQPRVCGGPHRGGRLGGFLLNRGIVCQGALCASLGGIIVQSGVDAFGVWIAHEWSFPVLDALRCPMLGRGARLDMCLPRWRGLWGGYPCSRWRCGGWRCGLPPLWRRQRDGFLFRLPGCLKLCSRVTECIGASRRGLRASCVGWERRPHG
ncbi:hypothetical protein HNY73_006109 [Argiope bruennichi]|uniref:Uncharacterized protein n=1 Tax=Argiope bruennichi TaxID=94029 RepID=A0A8T0FJT2_ARGBR|nr:hypothetical protein HNY73_006109 [Argiope bruennichi]